MQDCSPNTAPDRPGVHPDASRYHRQTLVDAIGVRGQQHLARGHAVIVGCGALGCGVADLLARAGVGRLTIIDRDLVEWSNLQRQSLFDERHAAIGLPKAEAARLRLAEINRRVRVSAHVADLNGVTADALLRDARVAPEPGADPDGEVVLIDGCDNFTTRLLLNDVAIQRGIPYVYAGVLATRAMVMVVDPARRGACLRCVVAQTPAPGSVGTCETVGVLGPAVGVATALQSAEAMKVLVGDRVLLSPDLLEIDVWTGVWRRIPTQGLRDPACPCCVQRRFDHLQGAGPSVALCGRGAFQITPPPGPERRVDLTALAAQVRGIAQVESNPFLVRIRPLAEAVGNASDPGLSIVVFRDGRALVSGVETPERARAVFDRFVGS